MKKIIIMTTAILALSAPAFAGQTYVKGYHQE